MKQAVNYLVGALALTTAPALADDLGKCKSNDAVCVGRVLSAQIAEIRNPESVHEQPPLACSGTSQGGEAFNLREVTTAKFLGWALDSATCERFVNSARRGYSCARVGESTYRVLNVLNTYWASKTLENPEECIKELERLFPF